MAVVFATTSLLTWLPSYFTRIYGIPAQQSSTKASLVMLLALIGAPLGGYLVDRWRRTKPNARLVFPGITSIVAAVFCFLAFVVFRDTAQYICLLIFGVTVTMFIPAAGAITQDLVHPGLHATSYAIAVVIQNSLGAMLGPFIIGVISDRTNIGTALGILPVLVLTAGILFLIGSLFYKKDILKVTEMELEAD
jgi:MFS family permease